MTSGRKRNTDAAARSGLSMSTLIRSFGESSEADKPFEPFVGGPRLFVLLLYATVLVAASLEFFAGQEYWPGNWEVYNTYVLIASGVFVFLGMVMLLTQVHDASMDYSLPLPRAVLGGIGFVTMAVSAISLAIWGKDLGTWAIPLSIVLLYGFLMMLLGSRTFSSRESAKLFLYGTGMVVMIMMPVHEAFGVYDDPENYPFTLINLVLLAVGMMLALISVQSLQTRDGYVGAWLLGAMAIVLLAFHEQVGILRTGNYSPYDRALALIGITFSFLPLALYAWRERLYYFLMRRLRNANEMIERGEHDNALAQTEAAIRQCAKVGIDDRFALPWSLKGDALYRKKDYRKAGVAYETAVKIDPNDSASWCNLGNTHAFEGRLDEALDAFEKAIKADPDNGYAWNNKGTIYQRMDLNEEALISFDRATRLMPDPFDPHINMAKLFSRMGKSQEALKHYQLALALRPQSPVAAEGVQREHFLSMCMDQIAGWEQLGLDTSYLRLLLEQDPRNFVHKSKEFLASIVDHETKLQVVPGKEHLDINNAMKVIMEHTEPPGASLDALKEATQMREKDLVLPLALLMETERVHFRIVDGKQMYVSKGKAPMRPPPVEAPAPPPRAPERAPEPSPKPVKAAAPAPVQFPPERPRRIEPKRQEPIRPITLAMPPPMLPPADMSAPAGRYDWPAPPPKPPERKPIEAPPSSLELERPSPAPKAPVITKVIPPEPEEIPDLKPADLTPPEPIEMKRSVKAPPKPVKAKKEPKPAPKPGPAKNPEKRPKAEEKKSVKEKVPEKPEAQKGIPQKKAAPEQPVRKGLLRPLIKKMKGPQKKQPEVKAAPKAEAPKKEPPKKEAPKKEPQKREAQKKELPKKPAKEDEKAKAKQKSKEEEAPVQREVVKVEPTASLLVFRRKK